MGDDQIEIAVLIQIYERRSQANRFDLINGRFGGYVFEAAVPRVAKEVLLPNSGDEEIDVTIVVEISRTAAEARPRSRQARIHRDVGEVTGAVVAQQKVFHLTVDDHGAQHKNVGFAVAIVVEHDHHGAEARPGGCP